MRSSLGWLRSNDLLCGGQATGNKRRELQREFKVGCAYADDDGTRAKVHAMTTKVWCHPQAILVAQLSQACSQDGNLFSRPLIVGFQRPEDVRCFCRSLLWIHQDMNIG